MDIALAFKISCQNFVAICLKLFYGAVMIDFFESPAYCLEMLPK